MEVMGAVRAVAPPGAVVGAGVIRNIVWDHLHGHQRPTQLADVDVAFFDPLDLSEEREQRLETDLQQQMSGVPWQAINQAGVHLWFSKGFGYSVEPLTSLEDAVATWPETATAVAIRLSHAERLEILAPCGLEDLLGMVLRRNPRRVPYELFLKRLKSKRILDKWPRVRVIYQDVIGPAGV
jgi:hypothetical protein